MKLGLRILACYLVIFCVCFAYPVWWVLDSLRTRYLEGVEDPLVDQANILAGIVGQMMEQQQFDAQRFYRAFASRYARPMDLKIYNLAKRHVDMAVYITDARGVVIFHSRDPSRVGADYSHWRDVRLTLDGEYGARTSLRDPDDPQSSVLYVAAPVMVRGGIAGVLTVIKPTTNINSFLNYAKPRIVKSVLSALLAAVVLGVVAALWITRPIRRMTDYALSVSRGGPAGFPKLDRTEIGTMGRALRKMQTALEGKAYVERYVQQLTHEVKSPLSAIRGSAELLEEDVPADRRIRFLDHIRTEAGRIQDIVDRMLTLASLENKSHFTRKERIDIAALIEEVVESKRPLLLARAVAVNQCVGKAIEVVGDRFWLRQAVANLIQNAIDFSRPQGFIAIASRIEGDMLHLIIEDDGVVIPAYALTRVFDKFYSLKRPGDGRKSTGLGLNLVRQVAVLHHGGIQLQNRDPVGVRAVLSLPMGRPGDKVSRGPRGR